MAGDIRHVLSGEDAFPENNISCEPEAAQTVFRADWKRALLAPFQTSKQITLTGERYQRVYESDAAAAAIVTETYEIYAGEGRAFGGDPTVETSSLSDTLAVLLTWSTRLVTMERFPMAVTDEGITDFDKAGWPFDVAKAWRSEDALDEFRNLLVERLTG